MLLKKELPTKLASAVGGFPSSVHGSLCNPLREIPHAEATMEWKEEEMLGWPGGNHFLPEEGRRNAATPWCGVAQRKRRPKGVLSLLL